MVDHYPGLSEETLAAIREAARRNVEKAPPLKAWQCEVIARVFAERRATERRQAA